MYNVIVYMYMCASSFKSIKDEPMKFMENYSFILINCSI